MTRVIKSTILFTTWIMACVCLRRPGIMQPSVDSKLGKIKGLYKISTFQSGVDTVRVFLGIPYAQPPTGKLRFQKPKPFDDFEETFQATEQGPACPQVDIMNTGTGSEDEDCLYLNVFVPDKQAADKSSGHAVIVFIHGGGFAFGSGSQVSADILSNVGNVIVVTLNYRVGFFGFLNTGDGRVSGNLGLWDQQLAIKWVKENIAAFGGDPRRITLMGDSAGAISAFIHGLYPPNKGLFQNIIAISGSPTMPFGLRNDNLDSLKFVAKMTSCDEKDTDKMIKCFKKIPIKTFMKKFQEASKESRKWRGMHFAPTIDGKLIKQDFHAMVEKSKTETNEEIQFFKSLRLLTGVNSGEGGLWIINMGEDLEKLYISRDQLTDVLIPSTLPALFVNSQRFPDALIQLIASEYTNWEYNVTDSTRKYIKYMGDINFNVPAVELAMLHSEASETGTWVYRFDAVLSKHMLRTPSWLKIANQGDIIPQLFGYPSGMEMGSYRNATDYRPQKWELKLSRRIMTFISNFAKNGDPNANPNDPVWPRYELETQKYIRILRNDTVGQYPFLRELNFWRNVVPALIHEMTSSKQNKSDRSASDGSEKERDGSDNSAMRQNDEDDDGGATIEVESHDEL